jgi:hypothetical protein
LKGLKRLILVEGVEGVEGVEDGGIIKNETLNPLILLFPLVQLYLHSRESREWCGSSVGRAMD